MGITLDVLQEVAERAPGLTFGDLGTLRDALVETGRREVEQVGLCVQLEAENRALVERNRVLGGCITHTSALLNELIERAERGVEIELRDLRAMRAALSDEAKS